jgi:hypothetical protein
MKHVYSPQLNKMTIVQLLWSLKEKIAAGLQVKKLDQEMYAQGGSRKETWQSGGSSHIKGRGVEETCRLGADSVRVDRAGERRPRDPEISSSHRIEVELKRARENRMRHSRNSAAAGLGAERARDK